jgi:hypothetical protein
MKLISMTDFVLEQNNFKVFRNQQILNYANFLKQPLELWMFVPCDENGDVLEEPKTKWKSNEERCLFNDEFNKETLDILLQYENIESLVGYALRLTKTAIKQLGL